MDLSLPAPLHDTLPMNQSILHRLKYRSLPSPNSDPSLPAKIVSFEMEMTGRSERKAEGLEAIDSLLGIETETDQAEPPARDESRGVCK